MIIRGINTKILTISIVFLLFSSCFSNKEVSKKRNVFKKHYVVYEFKSDNLNNEFIFIDKNIKIQYKTNKYWDLDIENIANKPLYLDVGRSSLIINKISYNL